MIEENHAIEQGADFTKEVYPEHVAQELARLNERLTSGPDAFHHAGLYAAQQVLCWAAQPDAYASPLQSIVGSAEG